MNRKLLGGAGVTGLLILALALFATIGTAEPGSTAAAQSTPSNTGAPAISGTPAEGSTLTTSNGQWQSTSPIAYSYKWQRCDAKGGSCGDIPAATNNSYVLKSADVGKTLRTVVAASNADGVARAQSAPTAVVTSKTPQSTGPAGAIKLSNGKTSIPASSVAKGERLVIDDVRFDPSVIRSRNPLQLRVHLSDTQGNVVREALVYVTAIPFGRIDQPVEVRTDQEGWATLTLQPTARLPLRDGYLLTIFIRGRVQGQDVLAGSSTRRLVSARVGSPAS